MQVYAQDSSTSLPDLVTDEPVYPASQIEAEGPNLGFSHPNTKWNVDALLWGRSLTDPLIHSSAALTYIDSRLDLDYSSWLALDFQVAGYFAAGNPQNFYSTEGENTNGIYLEEAAANIKPFDHLVVRGGALYISMNPILSIMSQNGFLGTDEKYEFALSDVPLTITAYALQSVPSSGVVTKGLIDDNPDAWFLTETLEADLKLVSLGTILKVATTHYEFGNLSSNVASESQQIGNNVASFTGIGANTQFTVGFGGFETAASLQTDWGKRFSTELTGSVIKNNEALPIDNWGEQAALAVTTKFEKYNLIPSVTVFNMGADVTPATYTILSYRYQDRIGWTGMLKFELKKEKINFFGSYSRQDVIISNPYLGDRDIYSLGMEAKYDLL